MEDQKQSSNSSLCLVDSSPHLNSKDFYCCSECNLIPQLDIKNHTFTCANKHIRLLNETTSKLLYSKMTNYQYTNITCSKCGENKEISYCMNEKIYLCAKCIFNHDKSHRTFELSKIYTNCQVHNKPYNMFCDEHSENICEECSSKHSQCKNKIYLIKNNEDKVDDFLEMLKKERTAFKESINCLLKKLNEYKEGYYSIYSLYETMINAYKRMGFNYFIIENVNELLNNYQQDSKLNLIKSNIERLTEVFKILDNSITLKVNIRDKNVSKDLKKNIDEEVFIICDAQNGNEEKYSYNEITKDNCKVYINDVIIPFKKSYRFLTPGEHTVKLVLDNKLTHLNGIFHDCKHISSIDLTFLDSSLITNMISSFDNCYELESIYGLNKLNTSKVTNMSRLFNACHRLKTIDVKCFNTYNVRTLSSMFSNCSELTSVFGLNSLNTVNCEDMSFLFSNCKKLKYLDLSGLNTGNVVTFQTMFQCCNELENIIGLNQFNTAKVKDMSYMFTNCFKLKYLDISNFATNKVESFKGFASECEMLENIIGISKFNTSACKNMDYMFYGCKRLKELDLKGFDFSSVQSALNMLSECQNLKTLGINGNFPPDCDCSGFFDGKFKNKVNISIVGGDVNNKMNVPKKFVKNVI